MFFWPVQAPPPTPYPVAQIALNDASPPQMETLLKAKDWANFARGYNGPAYAKNRYDVKLAAAYAKFSKKK